MVQGLEHQGEGFLQTDRRQTGMPESAQTNALMQCFTTRSTGTPSQSMFLLPPCSPPDNPHFCSLPAPSIGKSWNVCWPPKPSSGDSALTSPENMKMVKKIRIKIYKTTQTVKKTLHFSFLTQCFNSASYNESF